MNLERNLALSARPVSFVQQEDGNSANINDRLLRVRSEPAAESMKRTPCKRPRAADDDGAGQAAPAKMSKAETLPVAETSVITDDNASSCDFARDYLNAFTAFINEEAKTDFKILFVDLDGMPQPKPDELLGKDHVRIKFSQADPKGNIGVRIDIVDSVRREMGARTFFEHTFKMPEAHAARRKVYNNFLISTACIVEGMVKDPYAKPYARSRAALFQARETMVKKFPGMLFNAFERKVYDAFKPVLKNGKSLPVVSRDDAARSQSIFKAVRGMLETYINKRLKKWRHDAPEYKILIGGLEGMDEPYPARDGARLEGAPEYVIYHEFGCSENSVVGEYARLRIHFIHDGRRVDLFDVGALCKTTPGMRDDTAMSLLVLRATASAYFWKERAQKLSDQQAIEAAGRLRKYLTDLEDWKNLMVTSWNAALAPFKPVRPLLPEPPDSQANDGAPLDALSALRIPIISYDPARISPN